MSATEVIFIVVFTACGSLGVLITVSLFAEMHRETIERMPMDMRGPQPPFYRFSDRFTGIARERHRAAEDACETEISFRDYRAMITATVPPHNPATGGNDDPK